MLAEQWHNLVLFCMEVTSWYRRKGHSHLIPWNAFSAVAVWDRQLKRLGFVWLLMSPNYFISRILISDICILSYIYWCWNLEAFTLRGGGWVRQQEEINFLSLPFCFCYKVFVQLLLFSSFKKNIHIVWNKQKKIWIIFK